MKFSIRDLVLLTVIVALVLGWVIDHWRVSHESRKLKDENGKLAVENAIETDKYMQLSEITHAFERALDEARPGWRRPDGTYDIETGPDGTTIPYLTNSSALPP